MVVAFGLTACVPPAEVRLYELPSVPVTVTVVALEAATVKVEEPPAVMDAGLALTETVGVVLDPVNVLLPQPASRRAPSSAKVKRDEKCWKD